MNLGEVRTAVRLRLSDSGSKIWSDAAINLFINDAIEELSFTEAMLKRYSFPIVDGTRTYSLPQDCLEVRGVKINGEKIFGTHAHMMEENDSQYLTRTGDPYYYYMDDLMNIAFYPVPTWTADTTTFETASGMVSGEYGIVSYLDEDSTAATFLSESGETIRITDEGRGFVFDSDSGIVVAIDGGALSCEISYVYKPQDLSNDSDSLSFLPQYVQDAVVWYATGQCLNKEGQGQDRQSAKRWMSRFEEVKKEWKARNLEWSRGRDQFITQRPVSWGEDLDAWVRVWPTRR